MSVTTDTLTVAIREAERFLARARKAKDELTANGVLPGQSWLVGTAASGAVKRASMDLTRVLADLRRSG